VNIEQFKALVVLYKEEDLWTRLKILTNWSAKSSVQAGWLPASQQTTYQWLKQFAEELRQRLRHLLAGRRAQEAVRARARELWEINGQPAGRDLEFWSEAERELREIEE
jgi:Protein of unknown function (DUF2934)